ncbi:hypothetical protein [Streptomyces sp. NPDC060031]|uniref:hypothetical protein n=1 Tax=Streptomyces sp. NPDC060031 TaxID=3347043 RepID=UPI0036991E7E
MPEVYEHVPHPLLRTQVRDIASGAQGELMAVVHENVSGDIVYARWVDLAYIRTESGLEVTTHVDNIESTS